MDMTRSLGRIAAVGVLLGAIFGSWPVSAQKAGGILRVHALDSPPSMSMHEEVDAVPARATMGLFNNLVMFDQQAKQNSMQSTVPDLATGWSWSEDGTQLTFPLREGVKWHDGKPFTAKDVKCTWDLLTGKSSERLRLNPRKSWYSNLEEVTTNDDYEVTFHLRRPQPAFVALLASGYSVVYPCHVAPAEISEGQGDVGGVMQPLPEGVWGMPQGVLKTLPGYDPDVQKNRNDARQIMEKLGYGPDKRLALKVSTRDIPPYRDPAMILTDQLKEVFIDGELEIVETASWFPKVMRKDYKIGLNLTGGGVDDPDQQFYENYACGAARNYTGYCNPELENLFDRQSTEADEGKRKQLVWEIERNLAEDGARPIIFYNRFAYCWQPRVKSWTMMVNSIINNWRMEDVWLDR
jgi:ABC-type transport system substrate-binding protein